MVDELAWQRAVGEAGYRQQFLDMIDLEGAGEYVARTVYHESVTDERMSVTLTLPQRFGLPHIRSRIDVYPKAFDFVSLGEFLSYLIDHEGFHAREAYYSPSSLTVMPWRKFRPFVNGSYVDDLFRKHWERELRALRNQMENIGMRNVSESFIREINDNIRNREKQIRTLNP